MDLSERRDGAGRHPWEVSRSRFFQQLVAAHVDVNTVRRVLDVGAGDGWFARQLRAELPPEASIVCWDANYTIADLDDGTEQGVVRTAVRPDGAFDLVLALDVLEHVEDDERFLTREVVPAIRPGGMAVLSVPTHPSLFSDHDRALQHLRRYAPRDFRRLIGRHLQITATGSLFASLLPLRAIAVLAERVRRRSDVEGIGGWGHGPTVTRAITAVLDVDAAVGRRLSELGVRTPGLSVWVVATNTGGVAR